VAKLIIESGPGIGDAVVIAGRTVVGRLQSCDLPIQESQASRQHFEVERIGECYQVKDLGSRNGTALNGVDLNGAALLSNGDVLGIGETRIAFNLEPPLSSGERFGDVKVESGPSSSGFGYRYLGTQISLGRPVAIEALARDFPENGEVWDRFVASMKAAGQVNHPGVLGMYSVYAKEHIAFGIVERFDGQTLRRLVRSRELSLGEAMTILLEVSETLAALHEQGKFHQRISPSTILVADELRCKLVGFGPDPRGRPTDPALPEAVWHAAFSSPESSRGLQANAAADLYSLGTVAFWLITGRYPCPGESASEVLRMHASADPCLPISALRSDIPPSVAQVVDRLLKKSPAERPQTAKAASRLLEVAKTAALPAGGRISNLHSQALRALALEPADEDDESSGERGPTGGTVARRGRRAAKSASSSGRSAGPKASARAARIEPVEAPRSAVPSTTRRRYAEAGISDRLVSPEQIDGQSAAADPMVWFLSLGLGVLAYGFAYVVTRVLLRAISG
jgi:serine/threonine protein kinase